MKMPPDWCIYERIAACFEVESAGMDASVLVNASLVGSISGVKRQIDILVDARWDEGTERRILFEQREGFSSFLFRSMASSV